MSKSDHVVEKEEVVIRFSGDSGDGMHFRIVNVWSGLALDVEGGAVVQKSISTNTSQEWSFDYQTHVGKKGQVAFFHYNYMYQPDWFYSWGSDAEDDCEYGDYHPQQWGWFIGSNPVILRGLFLWLPIRCGEMCTGIRCHLPERMIRISGG